MELKQNQQNLASSRRLSANSATIRPVFNTSTREIHTFLCTPPPLPRGGNIWNNSYARNTNILKYRKLGDASKMQLVYLFISFFVAKWCHVTVTNVRFDFFCHLLERVGSATLNGIKECKHLKPPIWKEKAMRMSFKTNNIRDVQLALSEQSAVHPCLSKSFNGTKEIPSSGQALSGRAALEAAKAKRTAKQASLQSEIIIGVGQGRSCRECELIWYPIFDT